MPDKMLFKFPEAQHNGRMSRMPVDRPQNTRISAVRVLAIAFAISLAAGYILFAQVNARRQPVARAVLASTGDDSMVFYPADPESSFANPTGAAISLVGNRISLTKAPPAISDWSEMLHSVSTQFGESGYVASSSKSGSVAPEAAFAFLAVKMLIFQSPTPGRVAKSGLIDLSLSTGSDTNPFASERSSVVPPPQAFFSVPDVSPPIGRMPMESAFLSPFSATPTPAPHR